METEMKYEVKVKELQSHSYGIWNNEMQSWQYVDAFKGSETFNLTKADLECAKLNFKHSFKRKNTLEIGLFDIEEKPDGCLLRQGTDHIWLITTEVIQLRNFLNQLNLEEK